MEGFLACLLGEDHRSVIQAGADSLQLLGDLGNHSLGQILLESNRLVQIFNTAVTVEMKRALPTCLALRFLHDSIWLRSDGEYIVHVDLKIDICFDKTHGARHKFFVHRYLLRETVRAAVGEDYMSLTILVVRDLIVFLEVLEQAIHRVQGR